MLFRSITLGQPVVWCIFLWYCYFIVNDIRYNPKFYRHSVYHSIVKRHRHYEFRRPFQKRLISYFRALILWEVALLVISFCFPFFVFLTVPLMIFFGFRYLQRLRSIANDMGMLLDQISEVRAGNFDSPLLMPADPDLNSAAQNLTNIQNNINTAVENQIKSERMKIELITNVSHDIKTPLTSIIGYVDLLRQEQDLPEHAKDYILILSKKSERLKNMVQDIFDLSKAASGNIDLQMDTLDLGKLLRQTLADMDESILESDLSFKIKIPEEPVFIVADGRKLYRVFQNLIKNALQYSLEGSRVYVKLHCQDGMGVAEIKNTSKFEIDTENIDLTERFVRGDASRSTEGSGLGLSIAKSFTEACRGTFDVSADSDLFCARVSFPLISMQAVEILSTEDPDVRPAEITDKAAL